MIIDKEAFKADLSNFYKEYINDTDSVDFLIDMYEDVAEMLEEYLLSVKRNQVITSMEALRRFKFAAFKGHPACYKVSSLLASESNSSYIGLSGDINQKVKAWNETVSRTDKIKLLTKTGNFIALSAKRDSDTVEPTIVDLTLKDIHQNILRLNIDYFFENNKIYLNGDLAVEAVRNSSLIATDVFVDYNFPYNLLGKRIGLPYTGDVSKPEYRDFIQMVAYVLVKGPTIKNIKDSFNIIAGWEGSNIVDAWTAKGVRKDMWFNPSTAILTPFDFLVTIPSSAASTVGYIDGVLGPKDERLGIFSSFLDVVKPTDTSYILALSELIVEDEDPDDQLVNAIKEPISDSSTAGESFAAPLAINVKDEFAQGDLIRAVSYDDGEAYDGIGAYDQDSLVTGSGNGYGDIVGIRFIEYPEYPIQFQAVKDILTGNATISFTDQAVDVVEYDIVRNDSVIHTVASNGDSNTINWTDTELASLGSGSYEYYARSAYYIGENRYTSRPSKKSVIVK